MNGFGPENLPYGIFRREDGQPRAGVAYGSSVLDLGSAEEAGLVDAAGGFPVFCYATLNAFASLGGPAWERVREQVAGMIERGDGELIPMSEAQMLAPVAVGDYVDFYSSIQHATNLGRIFRPDAEPLLPNWKHLPVGYHGRSGTIVVSGTPVVRPSGQRLSPGASEPVFGPSVRLDFELEIGFVTGPSTTPGEPVPLDRAEERIFGVVLVNDWSARDIQAWEYQPLGPFLGKSFATSISPWIVPFAALEPSMVDAAPQDPEPLPYLRERRRRVLDLDLEIALRPRGGEETVISRTNASNLYWTMPQQLAHATVNGASVRPGDLFASGTISGDEPGSYGSMIELSWNGTQPVKLESGEMRSFLEDGDTVTFRGSCGGGIVSFGEVSGAILPAR